MEEEKYIISEFLEFNSKEDLLENRLTKEEKSYMQNGGLVVAGVLQRADIKNGNGRIYPRRVLEREIENYEKLVRDGRALGEIDHPDSLEVSLKNASHLVTDVWWEGDSVMGKVKILNTESGNTLKSLYEDGVKLGISSRGLGSTRQQSDGTMLVEDDFQLVCFDFVAEPSTNGAFMMPLREAKNRKPNLFNKAYRINKLLNSILEL